MHPEDFDRLDADMNLRARILAIQEYHRALPETDKNVTRNATAIAAEIVSAGYGPIPSSEKPPAGAGRYRIFIGCKGGLAPMPRWLCEELIDKLDRTLKLQQAAKAGVEQ